MSEILDVKSIINKAKLLHQEGNITEAMDLYKKSLHFESDNIDSLRYLAICYVQIGEIEKAIQLFEQALLVKNDLILHMNLGDIYKKTQKISKAIYHYKKALEINPKYANAHNSLAKIYAALGKKNKALRQYKEALHADPSFILAHLNLGIYFFENQDFFAASTQFNNVLALDATHVMAQFYLGVLKLNENNLKEAFDIFTNILLIEPEHVETLVNLGVILLKEGKDQLAIDYFTKALALDETNLEARNNLAATFIHNDRYENALVYYELLLKEDTRNVEYLYNTGVAYMGLGRTSDAIKLFQDVLSIDNKHFGALSNCAVIQLKIGDRVAAINLLKRALAVNPADKTTAFMLAAISQNNLNEAYCPAYAEDLFNHYALYYEQHMQGALQYDLPKQLWEILHSLNIKQMDRCLDLGCGTGLCGSILKPFCKSIIGVDIACKMLAIAAQKNIYDDLIESEALGFLEQARCKYDLILAADVLPYFGDLEELFIAIKSNLTQAGLFIFTTEISFSELWKLQDSIRYSHNPIYIKNLCNKYGYKIKLQKKVVARKQENFDLEEMLFILELAN